MKKMIMLLSLLMLTLSVFCAAFYYGRYMMLKEELETVGEQIVKTDDDLKIRKEEIGELNDSIAQLREEDMIRELELWLSRLEELKKEME